MDFDFNIFTNLMTMSPERAMKYRDECHKKTISQVKEIKIEKKEEIIEKPVNNIENIDYNPDDFTEDDENEDLSNDITSDDTNTKEDEKTSIIEEKKEDILENTENSWNIEFTRADLIEKLENAGITYVKTSKDETLLKKCIDNNLL